MKTGRMQEPLSMSMDEVNERWPLIRYLMDDPVYAAEYADYVEAAINGPLNPNALTARFEELHELIRPYVLAEENRNTAVVSEQAFEKALQELIAHVNCRFQAVSEYLNIVR